MIYRKNAQGMLDYVILLAIVISALLIIGLYVRNSISGKMREAADTFGGGETYVPNVTGVNVSARTVTAYSVENR